MLRRLKPNVMWVDTGVCIFLVPFPLKILLIGKKKLSSAPIRRGVLGEGFYLMHIKVLVGGD